MRANPRHEEANPRNCAAPFSVRRIFPTPRMRPSVREYAISVQIGAPFIVCHVLPEAFNVRVLFSHEAGVETSFQGELTDKAGAAVRVQLDSVIGAESNSVRVEIETGTAHGGMLKVALRVARSADVPVLVAKPSPTGGGVLGATDFSDPALPAVKMAAAESRRRGVRFRLVHCLDVDATAHVAGAGLPGVVAAWPMPPAVGKPTRNSGARTFSSGAGGIGLVAETLVVRNSPATGILDAAQSVATGLIVVGTRGRTGLARLALGSVA
ncbi:MAG TPA: universal stress protein, partial [Vicinamibacterales bacterium]|nr:universal stress protein [Vicinamibacterales bacterium]